MAQKKIEEAEALKKKVAESNGRINELSEEEKEVEDKLKKNMMIIPNIIDPSVPIGKDDSENVEVLRYLPSDNRNHYLLLFLQHRDRFH